MFCQHYALSEHDYYLLVLRVETYALLTLLSYLHPTITRLVLVLIITRFFLEFGPKDCKWFNRWLFVCGAAASDDPWVWHMNADHYVAKSIDNDFLNPLSYIRMILSAWCSRQKLPKTKQNMQNLLQICPKNGIVICHFSCQNCGKGTTMFLPLFCQHGCHHVLTSGLYSGW